MIEIANWVANMFILGLGTIFLGGGLFICVLAIMAMTDYVKR